MGIKDTFKLHDLSFSNENTDIMNDRQAYKDIIKFEVDKAREATKRRIGKAFWRWLLTDVHCRWETASEAILRITGVSEPKRK